jgi:hypothetical protein
MVQAADDVEMKRLRLEIVELKKSKSVDPPHADMTNAQVADSASTRSALVAAPAPRDEELVLRVCVCHTASHGFFSDYHLPSYN